MLLERKDPHLCLCIPDATPCLAVLRGMAVNAVGRALGPPAVSCILDTPASCEVQEGRHCFISVSLGRQHGAQHPVYSRCPIHARRSIYSLS